MKVAIVGGAGFVGRELLTVLGRDMDVTAVIRGNPEISLGPTEHAVCRSVENLPPHSFDAVVNLAYPTSGATSRQHKQTRAIFDTVESLLKDGGRLVHASTLAVFGPALDRPVVVGPVRRTRDTPYVEAKIDAEHLAARRGAGHAWGVDIVRFGNVVGPASPNWAVALVQRLVTGRPVGLVGRQGFSNATDVANVASYLKFVLGQPGPENGPRFHHLAELSEAPWRGWIDGIAAVLNVEPVMFHPTTPAATGVRPELARVVRSFLPSDVHRTIARERVLGSLMRSVLRRLPAPAVERAKGPGTVFAPTPRAIGDEETFLAIMAAQQEFRSSLISGWSPEVTVADSVDRVSSWVARYWDVRVLSA